MRFDFLLLSSLFAAAPTSWAAATPLSMDDDIETITVTSQRVERSLYEVASNVTLVDEAVIKELRLSDLEQLVALAPNVAMQALAGDYDYIQMRGLPRNQEQPTVAVYIDGVPYSSLYGLNLSLLNIEKVEVLRGPQANLFGRNTRDGIIAVTTRTPGNETELQLGAGVAELHQREFEAALSTPLVADVLGLTAAGKVLKRGGTVDNSLLGGEVDDVDQQLWRLGLNWTPDELWDIRFSAERVKKRNGSYPYVSGSTRVERGKSLTTALDTNNQFDLDMDTLALQANWQFDPDWRLSAISSWSRTKTFGRFDADFGALPYGHQDTWLEDRDSYQELRLASTPGLGDKDWLFGLSYSRNRDNNTNEWALGMTGIRGKSNKEGYVAYGDLTWRLAESWQLQTGARWVSEQIDSQSVFNNPAYPVPAAQTSGGDSLSDKRWLGKVALSKSLDDHQTLYANYGQGYLSAGTTWIVEATDAAGSRLGRGVSFAPEVSRTMELGYKALLPEWRSSVDLTLYQSVIDDYQHFYLNALGLSRVASIEEVKSRGFEAAFNTRLTDAFDWMISAGYNEAEISRLGAAAGAGAQLSLAEGNRIPSVPKYNVHSHLSYQQALGERWAMRATLSWDHYGKTTFDFPGALQQKSFNLLAATVAFEFDEQWSIELWGKNLTDERYQQYRVQYPGVDIANYGMPRQVGVQISKAF